MAKNMNKLEIKNLSHTYKDGQQKVDVLDDISTEFESGNIYAIIGESGSGKTTLISLISALDKIQTGDILYNDKSIKKNENKFRLKDVSIVFQSYNLIPYLTAKENVDIALDFAKVKDKNKSYELLDSVGITKDEAKRLIGKLSGGQQQRVAIARAIASNSEIIVADEPTGNLDAKTEENILELFKGLASDNKIVIIVTHSKDVASKTNAIIYKMEGGKLTRE